MKKDNAMEEKLSIDVAGGVTAGTLLSGNDSEVIEKLKGGRISDLPDMEAIKKEWDPRQHKTITDLLLLPDREVRKPLYDAKGEVIGKGSLMRQPVNRMAFPFQQKIVNTAVPFAFANPVKLNAEVKADTVESKFYQAIKKLSSECKLTSHNRRMYRDLLRCTEIAEFWHVAPTGRKYGGLGFNSNYKVRVSLFTPWVGDKLYPYFDFSNDLIAFSREFTRKDSKGSETVYFETYTDSRYIMWQTGRDGTSWVKVKDVPLYWEKIPIVYGCQENVEWIFVQYSIERLEFLLSKFAETNDYHASPKLFFKGVLKGMMNKGDAGGILQGDKDSEAQYLSWTHAPESVKLEIDNLIWFIYSFTQTPDISFESVKDLNQISGIALKMLFMDAHLKVMEKREILDDYLQRRVNIQKVIIRKIGKFNESVEDIDIVPEITPYIIDDMKTVVDNLTTAAGKAFISRKTAMRLSGLVEDVDAEMTQIEDEEEKERANDIFNPLNV